MYIYYKVFRKNHKFDIFILNIILFKTRKEMPVKNFTVKLVARKIILSLCPRSHTLYTFNISGKLVLYAHTSGLIVTREHAYARACRRYTVTDTRARSGQVLKRGSLKEKRQRTHAVSKGRACMLIT